MMMLRGDVPNRPAEGTENAPVLKNRSIVGSSTAIGRAAVVRAQRAVEALGDVPRRARTRAVSGVPASALNVVVSRQPSSSAAQGPPSVSQRRFAPNGSSTLTLALNR